MTVFSPLESNLHLSWVFQAAILAAAILLAAGFAVRSRLASGGELPDEGVTVRNLIEVTIEYIAELGKNVIGDRYRDYFPLVGTIFFFILISNLMGLVPGLAGSTSDVNTCAAWAIISFGVYNYVGIREHGPKYIYKFMGPSLWEPEIGGTRWHVRLLAPLFLPLEIVLHGARIVTLTVRLLANMFADHTVVVVWLGLVPIAVPAIFMGLGMLVAFLQAFVFALLTMIYIGEALDHPH